MIARDFKATITYIRRLGYQVGEPLDLVVLTSAENKVVLEDMTWDGARSVSVYTPYEAGALLNLGSLGRPDQSHSDVLHAAWLASKAKPILPISRSAAMGDTKDDLRELGYLVAPYAAGLLVAAFLGWSGWTSYDLVNANQRKEMLAAQFANLQQSLSVEEKQLAAKPFTADAVRNVIDVANRLDAHKLDLNPDLQRIAAALDGDAVVLTFNFARGPAPGASGPLPPGSLPANVDYGFSVNLKLNEVIATADEAVQTARQIEQRFRTAFGSDYAVTVTREPVGAQSEESLTGDLGGGEVRDSGFSARENFHASYSINKVRK